MSPVNEEVQAARIAAAKAAAQVDDAERTARRAASQTEAQRRFDEDLANTEKFQRATYSAVGGSPLNYIGASPTHDGGIEFDFAELTNVKGTVVLNREQALTLMHGIKHWFEM